MPPAQTPKQNRTISRGVFWAPTETPKKTEQYQEVFGHQPKHLIMMGSDTQHTDNIFYGNTDALEPGTKALFHHVSFGQFEIASLPPLESTPDICQTDFRTVLYNFSFHLVNIYFNT